MHRSPLLIALLRCISFQFWPNPADKQSGLVEFLNHSYLLLQMIFVFFGCSYNGYFLASEVLYFKDRYAGADAVSGIIQTITSVAMMVTFLSKRDDLRKLKQNVKKSKSHTSQMMSNYERIVCYFALFSILQGICNEIESYIIGDVLIMFDEIVNTLFNIITDWAYFSTGIIISLFHFLTVNQVTDYLHSCLRFAIYKKQFMNNERKTKCQQASQIQSLPMQYSEASIDLSNENISLGLLTRIDHCNDLITAESQHLMALYGFTTTPMFIMLVFCASSSCYQLLRPTYVSARRLIYVATYLIAYVTNLWIILNCQESLTLIVRIATLSSFYCDLKVVI